MKPFFDELPPGVIGIWTPVKMTVTDAPKAAAAWRKYVNSLPDVTIDIEVVWNEGKV